MLFVYGSLMRGGPAHGLLEGATFLREIETIPSFTLVLLDGYPGLVRGGSTAVLGEVYDVPPSLLPALDRYEEVPRLYTRESVELEDGSFAEAYVLPPERAQGRRLIASGNYRAEYLPKIRD